MDGLIDVALEFIVISQQFRQNEQLYPRGWLELKAHRAASIGLIPNPGDSHGQYQGLPEYWSVQRKPNLFPLRKGFVGANPSPAHAQVQKQAGDLFPGLRARNLGRQVHSLTLFCAEVVEAWHADRLPHVRCHRGALAW